VYILFFISIKYMVISIGLLHQRIFFDAYSIDSMLVAFAESLDFSTKEIKSLITILFSIRHLNIASVFSFCLMPLLI